MCLQILRVSHEAVALGAIVVGGLAAGTAVRNADAWPASAKIYKFH
jgi:hypothetical protein